MGTRLTELGELEGGGAAPRVGPLAQKVQVIKLVAHRV
jgi:hypothetical protein